MNNKETWENRIYTHPGHLNPDYKPNYNLFRFMLGLPMMPKDVTHEQHEKIMSDFYARKNKYTSDIEKLTNEALPEDKWRHFNDVQQKRSIVLKNMTPELKSKYIKWAKDYDKNINSYFDASSGKLAYPKDYDLRRLAKGYIYDISETKRLWNEENIRTNWTKVPFGVSKEEWDSFDETGIIIEYDHKSEDCNTQ